MPQNYSADTPENVERSKHEGAQSAEALYGAEFDKMGGGDSQARARYILDQISKRGMPGETVTGERPVGLETSKSTAETAARLKMDASASNQVEGVNPDVIERDEHQFNEQENPGNYGGGVPEDMLIRTEADARESGRQGGSMNPDEGMEATAAEIAAER